MNKKQLTAMWTGIIVFVVMGLFPPWIVNIPWDSRLEPMAGWRVDFEYGFIISHSWQAQTASNMERNSEARAESNLNKRHDIDFPTLIIQWLIVGAITTGLVLTFRDRKQ